MHIRNPGIADAERLAAIHIENWRTGYRGHMTDTYLDRDIFEERRATWRTRLANPGATEQVLLAVDGDEIAGFSSLIGREDERWGNMLDNLHVGGEHKGRGIGELLLRETAARFEEQYPGLGMYLWVLEANHGARRFYERMGGVNAERDNWAPPDGSRLPCLRYVWRDLKVLIKPI
jgi:ribosomal protein S18 acetylase RimI-like enzyme